MTRLQKHCDLLLIQRISQITKKVFTPDHEKTTERIVSLAWSIYHRARIANDIRVENADDLMERRKLQNQAIAECDQLLTAIQIAKRVFHLRLKRVKYWGEMVEELKNHLRKWRESDADCFRKKH